MQRSRLFGFSFNNICASGSAVEHLLAKEGVAGSIPVSRFLRQKRQPFKGCLFSALRTTRDLVPVVRSPLRSGRRKTEVRWTSCAPSRAPYFMIVLLASLRSACGGVWGEGDARAYAGLACGGVWGEGDARAYAGLACGGVVVGEDARAYAGLACGGVVVGGGRPSLRRAGLWWSCGGGGRRCLRTAGLCL